MSRMILSICYRSMRKRWSHVPTSWSLVWWMTSATQAWVYRGVVPSAVLPGIAPPHHRLFQSASSNDEDTKDVASQSEKKNRHHYIFGYGSLICPESRRITNAQFAETSIAQPVYIQDWERRWCARTTTGYTAVGVVPSSASTNQSSTIVCMGLLLGAVNDAALADVDRREASYDRYAVPLQNVKTVSYKDASSDRSNFVPSLLQADTNMNPNVWVYAPKRPAPPDASHPILQSYVDIILRGCLKTGGRTMARDFIATTAGWLRSSPSAGHHWVDDRATPIYKRADFEYSQRNDAMIDDLLFDALEQMTGADQSDVRQLYDPDFHLQQLEQAIQQNAAHPSALQHVLSCVQNAK